MGLGLTERFVGMVRAALGLRPERSAPPDIVRLGLYPVKVESITSDGGMCDVTPIEPFNELISAEKNVELGEGLPGASAIVQQGAILLLGWKGGDPSKPFLLPAWVLGAAVDKLVLKATMIHLGDESGSQFIALANKVNSELAAIKAALLAHTHSGVTTGGGSSGGSNSAYVNSDVSAAQAKAK